MLLEANVVCTVKANALSLYKDAFESVMALSRLAALLPASGGGSLFESSF